MDMDNDLHRPKTRPAEVIFAGLRIVQNIFRWLFRLFIPTEQELIEARVYPGIRHS